MIRKAPVSEWDAPSIQVDAVMKPGSSAQEGPRLEDLDRGLAISLATCGFDVNDALRSITVLRLPQHKEDALPPVQQPRPLLVRAPGGVGSVWDERGEDQHVPRHNGVAQDSDRARPQAQPGERVCYGHYDGHRRQSNSDGFLSSSRMQLLGLRFKNNGSILFTMEKPVSINMMTRNRCFGCQNGFTIWGQIHCQGLKVARLIWDLGEEIHCQGLEMIKNDLELGDVLYSSVFLQ